MFINPLSGGIVAATTLALLLVLFATGSGVGADVATNESVTVQSASEKMSRAQQGVYQNMSANFSSPPGRALYTVGLVPILKMGFAAVWAGFDLGTSNPEMGAALRDGAPVGALLILWIGLLRFYRQFPSLPGNG